MVQLSDLPLFRGDETQDAERWQQDFLIATAKYSDQAVARLFISKLACGSPASDYINKLPHTIRGSWLELGQVFHIKWLSPITRNTNIKDLWSAFEDHVLTEDMIFPNSSPGEDFGSEKRILCWVEDHIRLGKATGGIDEPLIRLTKAHLPFFVLAALSLKSELETFSEFCESIAQIPRDILEMEKVRYQRTSQRQDRLWAIEQKLEEMSQKMDRYFQERNILIPSVIEATEDVNLGQDLSKENSPAITTSMDNIPQQHDFLTTSHAALQLVDSYTSPSNADMHQEPQHITISSIPLHWRKPVMPLHKIEQIGVAQRAVDNLMQYITGKNELAKPGDHQAADAWAILAIHSTLVPFSKRRKNKVEQAIVAQCPSRQSRDESTTKDQLKWALTFCYGFKAFSKPELLLGAISYWNEISQNCLVHCSHLGLLRNSGDQLLENTDHSTQAGSRGFCGSVFAGPHRSGGISSHQTTIFMTLSAFLAVRTAEKKYRDAALLSARCIQAHMMHSRTLLIKDCIFNPETCGEHGKTTISCFLTAVFLEGLSALALVTGDGQWYDLARKTGNAAMDHPDWHTSEGILTPDQPHTPNLFNVAASKGILIRGLHGAYRCNALDSGFQSKVCAYINVQYNALRDLAQKDDSYSLDWEGFYKGPLVTAQVAAMDVLLAAIAVNDLCLLTVDQWL